jgi:UDP:flavonoid glycosyltransferase YjiC (YdhE family)
LDNKKYVLVCVLNWGLGHASRSTPLISALQNAGFEPLIASDGIALTYLEQHFPDLKSYKLPAYNIHYKAGSFLWGMFGQLTKIAKAIRLERRAIKQIAKNHKLVGIVSDNRLGTRVKGLPSIYLTHQLKVKAGFFSSTASFLHQFYIKQFNYCLIPDLPNKERNLAGELSHCFKLPIPHDYLGILSRFADKDLNNGGNLEFKACIVLSGPEPARTDWEKEILAQIALIPQCTFQLVRGTQQTLKQTPPPNVHVIDLARESQLLEGITRSEVVVSRSGYSSLMDYACLGKKALLVPTSGQGEQEYLAQHLNAFFAVQKQADFNLEKGLELAMKKPGLQLSPEEKSTNWELLFSFFEGK